jgi:hypothetical protein
MQGVDFIITITDRDRCEDFTAWFRSQGIPLVLTALGQGTATTEILDCLGLEDSEKAVLFCVAPRSPRLIRRRRGAVAGWPATAYDAVRVAAWRPYARNICCISRESPP